ncbi:MAG TPA: hydantoinase/oxoprolinase family protein [Gaiellales bacterium]|jgi:N-methylhydantoinase A|nr:hydantoinase/oxoprolinase family protein [Gaiellales bacterium]
MTLRVATDIGGTFTDLVVVDSESGDVRIAKVSTTPRDLAQGVLDVIAAGEVDPAGIEELVHGTTVVINALTERTGARTALVTTSGFRDVLEIGRGNRPDMYNLVSRKPPPFVARRHRLEVRERVDRHGAVVVPLDLCDAEAIAAACERDGIEAIAVCLLHSYAHPEHEQALCAALRERLPGVAITASSEVTREWREYERTSTAVLNAYVQPAVDRYLGELETRLTAAGLRGPLLVMQSSAGTGSAAAARSRPIALVESGPAGGVAGAARIGERIGEPNLIYLDIGGTTAKCSLVEDATPPTTTEYRIEWRPDWAGYPVMVPVVDIVEIGAGGGSIARVDAGGSLVVGPQSAGADPGPAAYGRGGTEPTVTDAKLVAGVLAPEYFLGGRLEVRPELAREALRRLGEPLGHEVAALANGIIRLADANMISALKLVSVQRGRDPRDFALLVGGGGGGMHGAALGAELEVRKVIVPPLSGVFSAWGMCMTAPRADVVRTHILSASDATDSAVGALFAELEREAAETLERYGTGRAGEAVCTRSVDARYRGQEHTVRVPVTTGPVSAATLHADFHELHRRKYTFDLEGDSPVELVTFHASAHGRAPREAALPAPSAAAGSTPAPKRPRVVDFDLDGTHETAVYERSDLPIGFNAPGPLVIEEPTTTTLVHPGQLLEVDDFGNLVIWLR